MRIRVDVAPEAVDIFTMPTAMFRLLYGFFVIHHERRRILQLAITDHPHAEWGVQQLREAFPFHSAPRHLILDRAGKYGSTLASTSFRTVLKWVQGDAGIPLGGCTYLQLQVPIDPKAAKKILPLGLWLTDPPMATLTANRYEIFPLGAPFGEAALNIHVSSPWGKGLHCVWIVVDDESSPVPPSAAACRWWMAMG